MSDMVNLAQSAPGSVPPPAGAGAGFSPGDVAKPPKKGDLPLGVIASIQAVYVKEQAKQEKLQGMKPNLELKPGWGGQGT